MKSKKTNVRQTDTKNKGTLEREMMFPRDGHTFLAYPNITVDDCFRVRDLKIFRHTSGYYIEMLQAKTKTARSKKSLLQRTLKHESF